MSLSREPFEKVIPKVSFKDVYFSWTREKDNVISRCNFAIEKTGLWMIVGKNGSGKSTFLKLINGIIKPNKGKVYCRANVGMVFQNPDHQILMPNCRSELLININQTISKKDISCKIENVLDKVGLTGFQTRPVHTLSGGQKQRLTIACSLISDKNFILLDEPTSLLDRTSQLKVVKIIKKLTSDKQNPLTALWITHRYEELIYADAVAEMKNGNLSEWQKPSKFQYN
tara:strand:+ start:273 stop:956 length:684 start_codon:yes stop_codon:yes gene_type:complete